MSNTLFKNFSIELKKQLISSSIFKENHVFIDKKGNSSGKVIIAEEELDCIDANAIGNVEDLPRLVFIDEECEDLKVVVDGGELARNINKKKKPVTLQAYICPFYDKC